jgi:protein-disulfide isomerase
MGLGMTTGRKRKIMKRRVLRTLQILLVLAALGAAVSIWFFSIGLNSDAALSYKQELQVTSKEQTRVLIDDIDKVTRDIVYEASLPTRSGAAVGRPADKEGEEANEQAGQYVGGETAVQDGLTDEQKALVAERLKEEYAGILYRQKDASLAMLSGLVSQAKSDYAQLAVSGKSKVKLAAEYIAKVSAMEKQTDGAVEALVAEMYSKMEELGIDGRDAIVAEFRAEYRKAKEENRAYFWNKAKEVM